MMLIVWTTICYFYLKHARETQPATNCRTDQEVLYIPKALVSWKLLNKCLPIVTVKQNESWQTSAIPRLSWWTSWGTAAVSYTVYVNGLWQGRLNWNYLYIVIIFANDRKRFGELIFCPSFLNLEVSTWFGGASVWLHRDDHGGESPRKVFIAQEVRQFLFPIEMKLTYKSFNTKSPVTHNQKYWKYPGNFTKLSL